jgi:hypothetical protein
MKKSRSERKVGHRPGVIDRLTEAESAKLLRILLEKHESLRREAERAAADLVGASSPQDIADSVYAAVTSLDYDALNERAGSTRGGYVEPTEGAWELLDEAVEEFVDDMKRRMEAGFMDTAFSICRGIIAGLAKAEDCGSGDVLGWAPDFPEEEAEYIVSELLRACPRQNRATARDRIRTLLAEEAPLWTNLLERRPPQAVRPKSSERNPVVKIRRKRALR